MEKLRKISYLYFATGILLSLYSILSQNEQVLNIDDTYFVVSANDFTVVVFIVFLILGICFFAIEKYITHKIKLIQYLMFNIPFIYFIFSDLTNHNNPGYYLAHPIAYKWEAEYIPAILIFVFLVSILIFILLIIFIIIKINKKNMANLKY